MKMKLMAATAIAALAAATGASAQVTGFYAAADFGYHWPYDYVGKSSVNPPNNATTNTPGSTASDWRFRGEDDWLAFGRLGYAFTPNWRLELEGGYRPSDVDSVFSRNTNSIPTGLCQVGVIRTAASPACGPLGGSLKVTTAMVNAIYDVIPGGRIHPFVGIGAGVAWGHMNVAGQLSNVPTGARPYENLAIDSTDRDFAYQLLAGIAFDITDNVAFDVTGRYLRSNFDFGSVTTNAGPAFDAASRGLVNLGTFSGNYKDASVTAGLRIKFGRAGVRMVTFRGGRLSVTPMDLDEAQTAALTTELPEALYEPGRSQVSLKVPDDPAQRFPAVVRAADAILALKQPLS